MNERILEFLGYLKTLRNLEGSEHSVKSLERTIDKIERINFQIVSGEQARQIFPGIVGAKTEWYINSILKSHDGNSGIKFLDDISPEEKEKIRTITELTKIQGIGITRAMEYFNMGIKNIQQLNEYLSTTKNPTSGQAVGAKYFEDFKRRIPRDKVIIFANNFQKELEIFNKETNHNLKFNVMGSFIRGSPNSGDIDIMLFSDTNNEVQSCYKQLIDKLKWLGLLKETLSYGPDIFHGVGFIDVEFQSVIVDIKFVNLVEELPYVNLYYTGSQNFNEQMRVVARNFGFNLGNNEMTDRNGKRILARDEGEIFHILGMQYKLPHERNI